MSAHLIAEIMRLWAAETHLLKHTPPGTQHTLTTPPLFSAPRQKTAPQLVFEWAVPSTAGAAELPEVSGVRLRTPAGEVTEVTDPLELLSMLHTVAAYRAGVQAPQSPDLAHAQAAHDQAMSRLMGAVAAPGAESLWVRSRSLFFPTLKGAEQQQGVMWLKTVGFSGHEDLAPQLPLDTFDYPERVTECADLEGFSLRDADPDTDAEHISAWMNLEHLALSFRQAWPVVQWKQELELLVSQPFTRPLILSFQHTPVGYLELYRPAHMSIGAAYPTDPRTVGVHMGLADRQHIGRGVGRHLVTQFGMSIVMGDPDVFSYGFGEPDVLNQAARGAARHTLGQEVAELAFAHKCAVLISSEAAISTIRSYRE